MGFIEIRGKNFHDLVSVYGNACVCKLLFEPVDLLLEVEAHSTHYQNDTAKYFCQGHGGTGSCGNSILKGIELNVKEENIVE